MSKQSKKLSQNILSLADVKINGNRPWDVQIHNPKVYSRVFAGRSLALGESYMDGWWDCKALDQFFDKILVAGLYKRVNLFIVWNFLKAKITNRQKADAFNIGKKHYDIGNDLYRLMLDKRMNYSCGYWKNAKTLNQAQKAKLELICKKIGLKPGMTVLDIGCGWGGFAKYAAEKYAVRVLGITVSKEQAKLARELCKNLPVEIRLQNYRDLNEKFDRIISIGMFEHVGPKNHRAYMEVVHRCLKPDGLFLLHTIAKNYSSTTGEPWLDKYVFPDGVLPSARQITKAAEGLFVMEDWHSFGQYYDNTLMAWHHNFTSNWDKIKDNYDHRFYRMWTYYLLSCASSFRLRRNQLWQIVFSKNGVKDGYQSIR